MSGCAIHGCEDTPAFTLTYTARGRAHTYDLCAADADAGAAWVRSRLGVEPTTAPIDTDDAALQPALFDDVEEVTW